jgi:lipopolysaccharide heptosyltransferase II
MQTSQLDPLKNILAIRLDNIGDVVMLGPALRALREAYPTARITLMASPSGSQAAPLLPWVDDLLPWRAVWQDIAKNVPLVPEHEYQLVELLARRSFDAAFIFTSFSQSPYPPAYACYLAGIPVRAGLSREFGGGLLSHWVKPPADRSYQVERNLDLLRGVGLPVRSSKLEIRIPDPVWLSTGRLLAQAGIPQTAEQEFRELPFAELPFANFLVLAPGASAAARRYPEARFAEAARKLVAETGLPMILVGSQREKGAFPALEGLAAQGLPVYSLIGQTSVAEMAAIIHRSALVIANNSGSIHLAAALNRPMVILYSGTDLLEQWAPPDAQAQILTRPVPCAPCYNFQCPYHLECLDIPADEVVNAALSLLKLDLSPPPAPTHLTAESIRSLHLHRRWHLQEKR